ncbi:MAG: helix-turn-helix transcriptional regulator [Acidobacteriota bacterium]|nr:helix-turn-helix transcriptional regulator [Acidobacteriota bacterium]
MKPKNFDDLYRNAESHDDYWAAGVVQDFTEAIFQRMESEGVSRSELARRLETSPAYITKILRGDGNFTIATMVRLARALDMELKIELQPQASSSQAGQAIPGRPTVLAT